MAQDIKIVTPGKGTADGLTYYERNGKIVMRSSTNKRTDMGRTPKNMASRTKMSNVNMAWRVMGRALKGLFELQKPGQYEYNIFMSANTSQARVHLTKEQSRMQYLVADNFTVAQGTLLPPIQTEVSGPWVLSDLRCGSEEIGPEDDVSTLINRLVKNSNGVLHYGDRLTFVRLTQRLYEDTEAPYCLCLSGGLELDPRDRRTLAQAMRETTGGDGFHQVDGRLAAERREDSLVAWVRTRKGPHGETLAATQNLVGENRLLAQYTSPAQREEAINSYGPLK